jgi:IrrE N-terminal-like domain
MVLTAVLKTGPGQICRGPIVTPRPPSWAFQLLFDGVPGKPSHRANDSGDEPNSDEPTKVIRCFKPAPVFDVAQTDGAELPEVCIRLDGEDEPGLFERLRTVAASIGFSVDDADDLNGANGMCTHDEHRIQVAASNAPVQRVKTLAHELGHAILHAPGEGRPDSRAVLELEAESVAYVVCAAAGITSDDYSFGYVATWSGGCDEALAATAHPAPASSAQPIRSSMPLMELRWRRWHDDKAVRGRQRGATLVSDLPPEVRGPRSCSLTRSTTSSIPGRTRVLPSGMPSSMAILTLVPCTSRLIMVMGRSWSSVSTS